MSNDCFSPVGKLFSEKELFALLGANRNNAPVRLEAKPFSIPFSVDGATVKFADGSTDDRIALKVDEGSGGKYVFVLEPTNDGAKILSCVRVPASGDGFFGYFGGSLSFVDKLNIPKVFDDLGGAVSGKVAIITCGPNGSSEIAFLAGNGKKRTLKVDEQGNLIPVDDATVVDDGTKVTYKDDYKEIYNYSGGTGSYSDNQEYDVGVENAGKFAFIAGDIISGNSGTSGISTLLLTCNGRRVTRLSFDNSFDNVCDDESMMIIPIGTDGKLKFNLTVSNIGDVYAKAFLVGILSNVTQ